MTEAQLWWARDSVGRAAFEARAERLVGGVLARVRYFDLDARSVRGGARVVPEGEEWLDPPWRNEDHDLLDWGLELDTRDSRTFGASWYVTPFEGLDFGEERLLETWVAPDASVAIWDVTSTGNWNDYVGRTVTRVEVCWERVDREAFACHAVVLVFGGATVVVGGEGDNVGVTFGADAARARAVGPYSPRQTHFDASFRERVSRWFRTT
jgi:hypothetical protein